MRRDRTAGMDIAIGLAQKNACRDCIAGTIRYFDVLTSKSLVDGHRLHSSLEQLTPEIETFPSRKSRQTERERLHAFFAAHFSRGTELRCICLPVADFCAVLQERVHA